MDLKRLNLKVRSTQKGMVVTLHCGANWNHIGKRNNILTPPHKWALISWKEKVTGINSPLCYHCVKEQLFLKSTKYETLREYFQPSKLSQARFRKPVPVLPPTTFICPVIHLFFANTKFCCCFSCFVLVFFSRQCLPHLWRIYIHTTALGNGLF